jgi:YD repeat-containing protein
MPTNYSLGPFMVAVQRGMLAICVAVCGLGLTLSATAQENHIIKFDAPNSGTGAFQGTDSLGNNFFGAIVGDVTDGGNNTHGYVRTPDGRFEIFDAPGADPLVGATVPLSINFSGAATGFAIDTNGVSHGFVRARDGKLTGFDDENAGSTPNQGQGTSPVTITDRGVIAGTYTDAAGTTHGFVRNEDGKMTTIDLPGTGTFIEHINNFAVTSGFYTDANFQGHGFLRTPGGKVTTFDPPADAAGTIGTYGAFVADRGAVAGYYIDGDFVSHAYLRTPEGKFTVYDAPDGGTAPYGGFTAGTFVESVNDETETTGFVVDNLAEAHAWVRNADGKVTTFDVPGQVAAPGTDFGSAGKGINAFGVINGRWRDANFALHGFIRTPGD